MVDVAQAAPRGIRLRASGPAVSLSPPNASALLMTEQSFRRIMGYKDLWMLESALGRKKGEDQEKEKVA